MGGRARKLKTGKKIEKPIGREGVDKSIQRLEEVIRFAALRHKVLASNVANVDTPGYRAKDVLFQKEMKNQIMAVDRTHGRHLQGNLPAQEVGAVLPQERSPWGDGNNVVLDMELAHMTENALLYEAALRLLSRKLLMYKNAIKGR